MSALPRHVIGFLTSLRVTVVLLAISIVLIFAATIDQVQLGILAVQEKYFRSFFVFWNVPGSEIPVPIYPGGYLIGGLLLINLVAAHLYRFQFSWKRSGLVLTHAGLVLLLIGELLTGLWQRDSQMQLQEGETKRYTEDFYLNELALIDTTDAQADTVVAIPEELLASGRTIQHPKLPFQVRVISHLPNAMLRMREQSPSAPPSPATMGVGTRVAVLPLRATPRPSERNTPAAFVELVGAEGTLGTWLISTEIGAPQEFTYNNHSWRLILRAKRYYNPYGITLLKVTHDVYPGSDIPKNFASRIRLKSDDGRDDREVVVYMNNPLRYGGLTYYQYQMNKATGLSVFQVVRNPSWLLPYVSSIMMGTGLVVQFGIHLIDFVRRRYARPLPVSTP
ncbi:MAG: cytochrome c biogenesis protein ResB [Opitutaceae bacterium]|nr:cytochrome c biogenesis protein ResB [Opitutaceae bacterium]